VVSPVVTGTLATLLLAACAGSGAAPSAAPTPTAAPSAAAVATQPPATAEPSPTPQPTISGPHYNLVGLGDSGPGGLKCSDPCRSYVLTLGELAATALDMPVAVTNLATNDGLDTHRLLGRIQTDARHRDAIAAADIVTLQIGGNDWQGPCIFEGHMSCLASGLGRVEPNLDAILGEIEALRAGKPTAIRVVTAFNGYLGNKNTPSIWGFAARPDDVAQFDKDFRQALLDYNAMTCRVAAAHHAVCVDIAPAFNGPDEDQPAAPGLINSDSAHPLAAGHDLIARTIAAAGFAELK
jgi:lysophospholipase L1-like esterase